MPYIKVNVDKIKEYQQDVYNIRRKVNTISSSFSNISGRLDSDVKNSSGIRRKLQNIESSLADHKTVLQRTNTFLGNTSLKYINAEKTLYAKDKASGDAKYTDIDEVAKVIAKQRNLSSDDVADVILSGNYSIEEITNFANGSVTTGAFAASIGGISSNVSATKTGYSEDQKREIVALAATELGISEAEIHENISQGLSSIEDIAEFVEGKAKETNKFVKNISKTVKAITGSTKVLFTVKDGYVVVSKFTRNSLFNKLVQTYHDGTGLGTRYTVDGIKGTPVVGKVYTIDQIANKVDKVVNVVTAVTTGVTDVVEAGNKINDIWANDDLSKKEKIIDTSAVVVTSAIGTALDVAAPFAGSAVQKTVSVAVGGALSAVLPVGGAIVGAAVGYVAGQIVENGMRLVSDVITSEAVVNQVSESIEKVGDAVTSGVAAVSNANKKLMESKNAGEAIANTAKLVGTAVTAGAKVVATTVVESAKTAAKVVTETVKTVAKEIETGVKKAANAVKNFFKKW